MTADFAHELAMLFENESLHVICPQGATLHAFLNGGPNDEQVAEADRLSEISDWWMDKSKELRGREGKKRRMIRP